MEMQYLADSTRNLQTMLDVYSRKVDAWERELQHLREDQRVVEHSNREYSAAIASLQTELRTVSASLASLQTQTGDMRIAFATHNQDGIHLDEELDRAFKELEELAAEVTANKNQISLLVTRVKVIQSSLSKLSDVVQRVDELSQQNHVTIDGLDRTLKIGMGVAVTTATLVGTLFAIWEWLVSFFSK